MREAARHLPGAADAPQRLARRGAHPLVERRKAIPRDRGLERLADHPHGRQRIAQIRRVEECLPPCPRGALARAGLRPLRLPGAGRYGAAVLRRERQGARHPRVERMVGRLEGEQQHRGRAVARPRGGRLPGVEEPAVRGVEAGLRDGARRVGAARELGEGDRRGRAVRRPVLEPHPRLDDDAEDALRADEQPIRARAGARAGQPPRLDGARRRDHAQRLHEVVDVRVERRVMAAGAGRDPAAERRALERLREMTQRQAVRAKLILERRAVHARLDPGRPRRAVDVEHLVEVAQVDTDRAAVGVADVALHAADDGRAAAIGNRGRARVRAPVQDVGHVRLGAP